jgi:hypothetical protein
LSKPEALVSDAIGDECHGNLPPKVADLVDRQRKSLADLAESLLAAGHSEDEVVAILNRAADGFASKLQTELAGMKS